MCTDHTHDYSATTLACGHLPSDSGWHKLSYYRGCGHTDWHCLGAARHNPAKCPPGTNGELCTVWSAYPGWHYVCDTAHDHKYPSDSTTDPSDPKEGNSKPATDGNTDETDGTTNKKDGETDSTEGNSKQMVLAACGIHQDDFYQTILKNNLFVPLGTVVNPKPVPGEHLILIRTRVYPSDPVAASAWLKDTGTGEYRELFLGDSMAGLMLSDVQPKQVTLEKAGERGTLRLATDIFLNAKRR